MNSSLPVGLERFRATDREQCGVIVEGKDGLRIEEVENVAVSNSDYAITMRDFEIVFESLEPGETIIGFFHTHLPHHECEPTDTDFDGASLFPEFTNLIYKPDTKESVWYGVPGEVVGG